MKIMIKITAAILCVVSTTVSAAEWNVLGSRAMGMGGAGVASVQGPLASYWNPAALGRATENSYGLAIPVGAHAALTGTVIQGVNDLKNLKDTCASGGTCTSAQIQNALNALNDPNDGLRINAAAGADLKIGKLAIFADGFVDAAAIPVVDLAHTANADLAGTSPTPNTSKLTVKGANIAEVGAGYGHELPFAPGLFLGGNVKVMKAQVGYADYLFLQQSNNSQSNILSNLKNGAKSSSALGVDLGALWDMDRTFEGAWWQPRLGLIGRNLNNPKFQQPASATAAGVTNKFALNPQARLGGEISPFNWWHLASDVDLTRNLTPISTIASRQFGVGTEVDVFNRSWINIPLRFGIARNLENAGAGTMLTAGTGLNFLHLIIDASAQVSPQSIQTQSQGKTTKIPREIAAAVQVSFLFGGSDDRHAVSWPETPPTAKSPQESNELPPAQAEQIKQNAEKSQAELDRQANPAK